MNGVKLSICIVTYNKKDRLRELLEELMTYRQDDVDFIISDDNSSDGTEDMVKDLIKNDNRVKYFKHSSAYGPIKNWMASLLYGEGEYSMTLNDRDKLNVDGLSEFVELLNSTSVVAGYCLPCMWDNKIKFATGCKGIASFGYRGLHPSGYFFKKDKIKKLNCFNNFNEFFIKENVGWWPHDFLISECCLSGTVLFYGKKLVIKADENFIMNNKSNVESSSNNNNIWFSPKQRFLYLNCIYKHLESLPIDDNSVDKIKIVAYYRQLKYATLIYKFYMNNKFECKHYGILTKNMSKVELINIQKTFYNDYKKKYLNKVDVRNRIAQISRIFPINLYIFGRIIWGR